MNRPIHLEGSNALLCGVIEITPESITDFVMKQFAKECVSNRLFASTRLLIKFGSLFVRNESDGKIGGIINSMEEGVNERWRGLAIGFGYFICRMNFGVAI